MARFLPERPLYRKERLTVGYPVFSAFLLLFFLRLISGKAGLHTDAPLIRLLVTFVIFVLPAAVFLFRRGRGYLRVLRLNAPRARQIPLLFAALFAMISGGLLLSVLCGGIATLGNSTGAFENAAPTGLADAIGGIFTFALLPAAAEEFFFRGVVTAEYERRGAVRAVVMSALLFSLIHFDLRNFLVYLFSGVVLSLVLFATDSLIAAALLHAAYNLFSLFGQRYLNALYDFTGSVELFLFCVIAVFFVAALCFCRACARLYRRRELAREEDPRRDVPAVVQLYTTADAFADPPILLCVVLSIVGFIIL